MNALIVYEILYVCFVGGDEERVCSFHQILKGIHESKVVKELWC